MDLFIGLIEVVAFGWLAVAIIVWAFSGSPRRPRSYTGSTREFLKRK